ncbi:MAG: hypothetical protein IPK83_08495 [Planctomycetes bacterium]|nr:hypothetical protein [Planctomycetota bacterium]
MNVPNISIMLACLAVAVFAIFGPRKNGASRARKIAIGLAVGIGVVFVILLRPASRGHYAASGPQASVVATSTDGRDTRVEHVEISASRVAAPPAQATAPVKKEKGPRWKGSGGLYSIAALAALVSLTYVFLDAGRRGRYTLLIRAGSAAAFIGLCAVLWRMGPLTSQGL